MRSDIESVWFLALASKWRAFSEESFACSILIILSWLVITLIYWAHPGGSAWGKFRILNRSSFSAANKPIPGPRGLPLIGSMNLMANSLAHHRIAAAAEACKAKRLMAFSLGDTRVIVTCNPDVAKEILNSSVFADRPVKESAYSLMFNRAIGFAPYGVYWRTLRRIAATHLFCPKQIKGTEDQRREIASEMVTLFAQHGQTFPVRQVLKRASLNNMTTSIFGLKYKLNSTDNETEELQELVDEGYDLLGTLNWSDHLPWLADFDPQKIRVRCSNVVPKVNRFVARIISEHRAKTNGETQDFVDVLLSLQGTDKLSDSDMIAVLVHDELNKVVGRSRAVEESDVTNMIYLPAVIKEVLRLHPPGPLLSWARLAITDVTINGYDVPKGTMAMVNMWAISRDPQEWEDPLEFIPDRFVTKEGEVEFSVLGSDLRLAPFGSGRRSCPGKNLGLTTVSFWVATLMHEFEWLPSDQNTLDLSEVLRLSCEMAHPLMVKVRPRRRLNSSP
ncbi:Cytochrome P450 78A6 [Hibiscus syriacus]|uniref:Cytochrome P450 78A6 n=1 Tax=Hibiscus syriacus TaxID=106335 RepID=A0A6A2XV50_HIBSY|nr:Cytochrome P450 78A6 [Hibiscus syriacus]